MKPRKRVFCVDCGRLKLVFKTEKKAKTFIKFNAGEIEKDSGRAPQRAYYCESCGGWHTTSMKHIPHNLERTKNMIEKYEVLK